LTIYLDTSLLTAALTPEIHTQIAQQAIAHEPSFVSAWVEIELAAALSGKCRAGKLDNAGRLAAWSLFRSLLADELGMLPVGEREHRRATELALEGAPGLRGADALHLAIASLHDATLYTLDRRQAEAGEALGLAVRYLL
jgi:predicted nucleic acid-binding protein